MTFFSVFKEGEVQVREEVLFYFNFEVQNLDNFNL